MLRFYSLWRKILKETRLQNSLTFISLRAEALIFAGVSWRAKSVGSHPENVASACRVRVYIYVLLF